MVSRLKGACSALVLAAIATSAVPALAAGKTQFHCVDAANKEVADVKDKAECKAPNVWKKVEKAAKATK